MRALVFAMLGKKTSVIRNYLHSPDTEAMIRACQLLGTQIRAMPDVLEVQGNLRSAEDVIDAGNSGQVLRFIGAIAGLAPGYTIITGDPSIRQRRVVQPLLDGLNQLGAWAVSSKGDGHAPIIVKGHLKGGTALIEGHDSQPVSGLLIAAAFATGKTQLFVTEPGEIPWVGLTLSWFDRLGISYQNSGFERYEIVGNSVIEGFEYTVPADWSSALYPIAAALVTQSELTIDGVDFKDAQGDKEVISVLQEMGARFEITERSLTVFPSKLRGIKIDMGRFIDAMPLIPVIACFAEGKTEIVGGGIARKKECDRISSIAKELKKMGGKIEERDDGMIIEPSELVGATLESFADHRMAMSLTVAGLGAKGESTISGTEVVSKSFPGFFDHMRKVGAEIE